MAGIMQISNAKNIDFDCLLDESCGNFCSPDTEKLFVQIFANYLDELPPLKQKGDFIYFYNLEVTEWNGQ